MKTETARQMMQDLMARIKDAQDGLDALSKVYPDVFQSLKTTNDLQCAMKERLLPAIKTDLEASRKKYRDVGTYRGQICRAFALILSENPNGVLMTQAISAFPRRIFKDGESLTLDQINRKVNPMISESPDFETKRRVWNFTDLGRAYWLARGAGQILL